MPSSPELIERLANASDEEWIAVACSLQQRSGRGPCTNEEVDQQIDDVLRYVENATKLQPVKLNKLLNIQSFIVVAPAKFVRTMIAHGDIASAIPTQFPEELVIRPKKSEGE